jgi:alpha-beta hydrolase superfamily lysophospholipase
MNTRVSKRIERVRLRVGNQPAEIALHIWEPPNAKRTTICVHGFAGTGGDFGPLAETLTQQGIRVIAPDLFGRGRSSFLKNARHYNLRRDRPVFLERRLAASWPCWRYGAASGTEQAWF